MRYKFLLLGLCVLTMLASCKKKEPQSNYAGTVTDICGNTYNYVRIGEQYWMAENMRCGKYDTESERKGEELSTSNIYTYAPYYVDASDKSLWNSESQRCGVNLTPEQVSKLGYLYNWAAVVGLATAEEAKNWTEPFSGNRQGICPNGWHVPTIAEWDALGNAIGGTKDKHGEFPDVGKKLKTTSGWHENSNGTDDYSFAALPAGELLPDYNGFDGVGEVASFCTATSYEGYGFNIFSHDYYLLGVEWGEGDYNGLNNYRFTKGWANSVRCVKN